VFRRQNWMSVELDSTKWSLHDTGIDRWLLGFAAPEAWPFKQ
jgi:hypothetical protein